MKNFEELIAAVKKKGFGSSLYGNVNGEPVYLSRGIREVYFGGDDIQKIIEVVNRFQNGDYGNAQETGVPEREGHEYGRYDITTIESADGKDTAVWVHRAEGSSALVYYKFER